MKQETPEEWFRKKYPMKENWNMYNHTIGFHDSPEWNDYTIEEYHQERLKQSLPSKEEIDTVAWQKFGGQGGSQNTYREIFRSGIRKGIELLTKGE